MRPANLLYGLEDRPPLAVVLLSGLQHVAVLTVVGIIFPLLVLERAGVSQDVTVTVLGLSMIAMAISSLLQCSRWGAIGSGFLAPATFTAAYLPPSLSAASEGGLPLVFGMTIFAGLCQVLLVPAIRRLRPYLPTEIAGLAVTVSGILLGILGFRLVFGVPEVGLAIPHALDGSHSYLLGLSTLAVTVGLCVWGGRGLRAFAALIGLVLGCLAAIVLGFFQLDLHGRSGLALWFELPRPLGIAGLDFAPSLAPEFFVGALICSLRAIGDITTCQKINDARWVRADFLSIRRGILADGLGSIAAGLLGTLGTNTSSGSIGLSVASGVTARRIVWGVAFVLLIMSMVPVFKATIAAIPREVIGGILIFSSSFIILNGIQVMTSRLLDNRKIILIGVALVLGLTRDIFPGFYLALPEPLSSLMASQFVLAIGSAILLNLIFRIGISRRARLAIQPGPAASETIQRFMEEKGALWGAQRQSITRVTSTLIEFAEQAPNLLTPGTTAEAEVVYDEFTLVTILRYRGQPVPAADVQSPEALLERDIEEAMASVATLLLRRLADRCHSRAGPPGDLQVLRLEFDA